MSAIEDLNAIKALAQKAGLEVVEHVHVAQYADGPRRIEEVSIRSPGGGSRYNTDSTHSAMAFIMGWQQGYVAAHDVLMNPRRSQ